MRSTVTWRHLAIGLPAAGFLALGLLGGAAQAQIKLNNPGTSTSAPPPAPAPSADSASGDIIDGRDIEQLANILREQGFQARIGKSSDGQARINSAAGGVNFSVTTYSCTPDSKGCSIDFFGNSGGGYIARHFADAWPQNRNMMLHAVGIQKQISGYLIAKPHT